MTLRPRGVGVIGIRLSHRLTPAAGSVHVSRKLELTPRGPTSFLMRLAVGAFRAENERMMTALNEVAERPVRVSRASENGPRS